MKRRYIALLAGVLVFCVVLILPIVGRARFGKLPLHPVSVDISLLSHSGTVTNVTDCDAIVTALNQARRKGYVHACPSVGTIMIDYGGGKTNQLTFLIGHGAGGLEFVSREDVYGLRPSEMVEILERAGVTKKK